ncbi:MAG: RNA pseudouridine synthase [Planctomycetes bacterium]|nr:RNA pseudouridine synthase [Planctomycetota bacterium]
MNGGAAHPPQVLHCDNHVLGVVKPAGMPIVPDASGDPSLLEWAKAWIKREYDKPGEVFLGVVHRLDRPVSGVVVFGRTSKGAQRLSAAWREGKVQKHYLARTDPPAAGRPGAQLEVGASGSIEQWLWKDRERNLVRVVPAQQDGAKQAISRYTVQGRAQDGGLLLVLEPVTGRSHQLRLACAVGLGAPIRGDLKYGAQQALPARRIDLHAARLRFPHPTRDEEICLECPISLAS